MYATCCAWWMELYKCSAGWKYRLITYSIVIVYLLCYKIKFKLGNH